MVYFILFLITPSEVLLQDQGHGSTLLDWINLLHYMCLMENLCLSSTGCARHMWIQIADPDYERYSDKSRTASVTEADSATGTN